MTLIIAAAQSAAVPGDVSRNVARHLEFGAMAAGQGAQLLVFPELSLTGYEPALARSNAIHSESSCLDPLRRLSEVAHMTVVVGAPLLNDKDELHIAAFAICCDGLVSTYTKEHLHPGEEKIFTPGPGGPMVLIEEANVALAICADTTHPQHAAGAAARGANVYAAGVLITENGYAPDTVLLRNYALDHKMAILMANYSGVTGEWVSAGKSAIWSENGTLVTTSKGTGEELVVATRRNGVWDGIVLPVPLRRD
ncbi:MAG TPA: carbon-nitrogen hydrolase family protein [Terracidiphilus sp.]